MYVRLKADDMASLV